MNSQCPASAEATVHPLQVSELYHADTWKVHPFWPHRRLAFDRAKLERTEEKFAELVADIEEHGIQAPLLVDMTYKVLDGHARLQAAQLLGLPTVPVRVLWNISQRECHLISLGGPDSPQLRYLGLRERLSTPRSAPPELSGEAPVASQGSQQVENAGIKPPPLVHEAGANAMEEALEDICHGNGATSLLPGRASPFGIRPSSQHGASTTSRDGRRRAIFRSLTPQEAGSPYAKYQGARAPPPNHR